ncbi:MAG: hypothetical protein EOO40_10490 [Deltaproteobacteria bacterium]|nr:MAG: hypothetical protein EOO40_10490 [Deltaproteobacteria bacterium]
MRHQAFNGPRWRPLTIKATPAVMDGGRYRALVLGTGPAFPTISLAGFELIDDTPQPSGLTLAWASKCPVPRRTGTAASAELLPTLRPAFRRLIMAEAGEVELDCRDALTSQEFWDIGLDRQGLTFRPGLPHVV